MLILIKPYVPALYPPVGDPSFSDVQWDPTKIGNASLSNGNLTVSTANNGAWCYVKSTIIVGKFYWEVSYSRSYTSANNGYYSLVQEGSSTSYLIASIPAGSYSGKLMFAVDLSAGKAWRGHNGVWEAGGNPSLGTTPQVINMAAGMYRFRWVTDPSGGMAGSQGNTLSSTFFYTAPSGFVGYTGPVS